MFSQILTLIGLITALAQQVCLDFQETPLSRVLARLDEQYPDASIHFILDEVAPYQVSIRIEANSLYEAVRQSIAGLPFTLRVEGQDLFVNLSDATAMIDEPRNAADAIRSYYLQEVLVYKPLSDLLPLQEDYVIDLSSSDLRHRGSAIDVLSYLPGLCYSHGQIMAHNATTPIIYIDDVEVNAASELFSLRSEEISRVAYAESANSTHQSHNGGIIKIYTSTATNGWDVKAQTSASVAHRVSLGEQFRVGWNSDRMRILANIGMQQINEHQEHHALNFHTTLTPSIPSFNTHLQLSCSLTPHHLIGAKYDMFDITRRVTYWSRAFGIGGNFDAENIAGLESWEKGDWTLNYSPRHDLRLYYEGKMSKCRIRFDLGYYSDAMKIIQQELLYDYLNNNKGSGQRVNGIANELLSERLDIALPLGAVNLHVGNEYTLTRRCDTYLRQFFDVARMSIDRSEHQSALFALAQKRWRGLLLEAGLRSEYLHTISHQASTIIKRKRNYLRPFVDIRLPWGHSEVGLTYSLHTQRPAYEQLNGYTRFNQYILFITGNPDLKPSLHHRFGLTYRHKDLRLNINYQHIRDYLASIITFNDGIYCMQYDNLPSAQELEATLSYSPRLEHCHPIISSTLLAQDVDLPFKDGSHRRLCHPIWYIDVHCPFLLTTHSQLWLDGHYHNSGHMGSTLQGATGTLHLGFSYQFLHWDFSVQVDDLFKTGTTSFDGYGPDIDYHHSTYRDTQRFALTFRYHLR